MGNDEAGKNQVAFMEPKVQVCPGIGVVCVCGGVSCPVGARAKGLRNCVKCLGQGSPVITSVTCLENPCDRSSGAPGYRHEGGPGRLMAYPAGGVARSEGGGGREGRKQGGWEGEREGRGEGRCMCIKAPGRVKACHLLTLLGASLSGPGTLPAWTPHGPVPSL